MDIHVSRVALISHDYSKRQGRARKDALGRFDFSGVMTRVLRTVDKKKVDTAVFSLFTIHGSPGDAQALSPDDCSTLRVVALEVYGGAHSKMSPPDDVKRRGANEFIVFVREGKTWTPFACFQQAFGKRVGVDIPGFVRHELPRRVCGDIAFLLCGEINALKYVPANKRVEDVDGVLTGLGELKAIFNPIHDKMTRFEMRLKQEHLSRNGRYVLSTWNKGKRNIAGNTTDGPSPAWRVFHNGILVFPEPLHNDLGIEIGVIEVKGRVVLQKPGVRQGTV